MRLKHHRFRFGLTRNFRVFLCRIFGHRVSDDPTGFACQRCRLAYEEIYSPGYWANMLEWFGSDDRDDDVNMDMPILDGSEMIGEETVDEYLDRIVAQKGKENSFDTAKNVLDGMLGIGGIPSNEEFCEELIARLREAFGFVAHDSKEIAFAEWILREGFEKYEDGGKCWWGRFNEEKDYSTNELFELWQGNNYVESPDEYLDRLVKEASPSWQGVDLQRFMDEARGRNVGLEWKKGAPEEDGWYVMILRHYETQVFRYWIVGANLPYSIIFHIGPIPPPPQNDEL